MEGRTRDSNQPSAIQGNQLVHLRRAQKGLSPPNCAHYPPSRVHYGRLKRSPVPPVDAPRRARSHGFQGGAGVLELSAEVHHLNPTLLLVQCPEGSPSVEEACSTHLLHSRAHQDRGERGYQVLETLRDHPVLGVAASRRLKRRRRK